MLTLLVAAIVPGFVLAQAQAPEPEGCSLLESAALRASLTSEATTPGAGDLLGVEGMIQFRALGTFGASADGLDDPAWGFQSARVRLKLKGDLPQSQLSYDLGIDISPGSAFAELLDAFVLWRATENLSLRVGQGRAPFSRETDFSSSAVTGIESSMLDGVFGMGRTQGVMLTHETARLRGRLMISDGRNAINTPITSGDESDFAASARVEARLGDAPWKQLATSSGFPGDSLGALLGFAAHWQEKGSIPAAADLTGSLSLLSLTADVSVEGDGWHIMAAAFMRTISGSVDAYTDFGAQVQSGLFVREDLEVYGRVSLVVPDTDRPSSPDPFWEVTLGAGWYPIRATRAVKITGEIRYYPEPQRGTAGVVPASTRRRILDDESGGQVSSGLQIQLLF